MCLKSVLLSINLQSKFGTLTFLGRKPGHCANLRLRSYKAEYLKQAIYGTPSIAEGAVSGSVDWSSLLHSELVFLLCYSSIKCL